MEKWFYSGEQLRNIGDDSLFRSRCIINYLEEPRKLIIISSKGMGKTHLLRNKRQRLAESERGRSAVFIPASSGHEIDRQTSLPKSLGRTNLEAILQDDWATLWEISIAVSVLLKFKFDDEDDVERAFIKIAESDHFPEVIKGLFSRKVLDQSSIDCNPSFILNELLLINVGQRHKLVKSANNLILQTYQTKVSSAVYVFIDTFDQTLANTEKGSITLWNNGQCGLALAAFNIFENNNHIKVYTSIRQEAWTAFQHEHKAALRSFCEELSYSKNEIKKLVDFLCGVYEGKDDLAELFRTREHGKIQNKRLSVLDRSELVSENLFDYVYRHSLGSPRSIIHLVGHLLQHCEHDADFEAAEKCIRHHTNVISGMLAAAKIDGEMAHFLRFLSKETSRIAFFSMIHSNVLNFNDMERISNVAGGEDDVHPFCELYNLGLLGSIRADVDGEIVQHFKTPKEFDWRLTECMPKGADYYILHPALEAFISNKHRMNVEEKILVSPDSEWQAEWSEQIQKKTLKIFISYSTKDRELRKRAESVLSEMLLSEGIRHNIWVDEREVGVGEDIPDELTSGIDWTDIMICLITENYVKSGWCKRELSAMHTRILDGSSKKLLPFIIGDVDRADIHRLLEGINTPTIDEDANSASLVEIGSAILKCASK